MKKIKLAELTPDNLNANKGTQRGLGQLEKSLQNYGAGRSITVDKNGRIISGNKTTVAAASVGIEDAILVESDGNAVIVHKRTDIDIDTPMGRGLAIADNRVAELNLDWDLDALEELADQGVELLDHWTEDELKEFNFHDDGFDDLDRELGDSDEVPEVQEELISRRGDLWILGDHRVLCGDSTNADDVTRLMDGERADMVFTDPPYDLAGSGRNFAADSQTGSTYRALREADWDKGFDIDKLSSILPLVMASDASAYVTTSHLYLPTLIPMFDKIFHYSNVCLWAKPNPMPSLSKRHWTWCHEFVVYGTRGRHTFNFPAQGHALSVWYIANNNNVYHPTQKPVAVPAHAIRHSSKPGSLLVDLFLGSGSTIIAAEETGRKCYGMELSPQYVDVIVRRWQEYTGQAAVHADGHTFETAERAHQANR